MVDQTGKSLPKSDYVMVVKSLYLDAISMLYGAMGAAAGSFVGGYMLDSLALKLIAIGFVLVGLVRYADMRAFPADTLGGDDAVAAVRWERRYEIGAYAIAFLHGLWCFASFTLVDSAFAELSSSSISIGVLVGVASRNFGIDRLVTVQSALIIGPLAGGLMLTGDMYHVLIALILLPFFLGIRRIAGNVRNLYLSAVHGRVDVSRLATALDTALDTMPHGLCLLDRQKNIAIVNHQAQRYLSILTGAELDEDVNAYVGHPVKEIFVKAEALGLIEKPMIDRLCADFERGQNGRFPIVLKDGRHIEITVNSRQGRTVLLFEDITERVLATQKINFMARYDDLTGLANRNFFTEQVNMALGRQPDLTHGHAALILVDIDDFKHVNDTMGHPAGDALLVEVGRRLKQVAPEDVLIGRLGGDEFVLFFPFVATTRAANGHAEAVLKAFEKPFFIRNAPLTVHASIGVTLSDTHNLSMDELLGHADLALYDAKQKGKGRYCVFEPRMDVEYRETQKLKADLIRAIKQDELMLHFQPIVDFSSRCILGCEALLRWKHPELGFIPPPRIIELATEIGVIPDVTRAVLRKAVLACKSWPDAMTVSVNLTAIDLHDSGIVELVDTVLDESGLAPGRLVVEITETAVIENLEQAQKSLSALRARGIGVALDDFGTGYSSLSYLHTLPLTTLKIDRAFVVDVTSNSRSLTLLTHIADLSRSLNLSVTVEGIENEAQVEVLRNHAHVNSAQGYLFGAPLPEKDMAEMIARLTARNGQMSPLLPRHIGGSAAVH